MRFAARKFHLDDFDDFLIHVCPPLDTMQWFIGPSSKDPPTQSCIRYTRLRLYASA
jgi:hypothetical protein